jgi:hypothetical protein
MTPNPASSQLSLSCFFLLYAVSVMYMAVLRQPDLASCRKHTFLIRSAVKTLERHHHPAATLAAAMCQDLFSKSGLEQPLVYLLHLLQETFSRCPSDRVMLWIAGRYSPLLLSNSPLLQHLVATFPLEPLAHPLPSLRSPLPVFQKPPLSVLDALRADRDHLPRPTIVLVGQHLSHRTTSLTTAGRSFVHHIPTICIPRLPSQHRMMPWLNSCKTCRDPRPSLANSAVVWLRTLF